MRGARQAAVGPHGTDALNAALAEALRLVDGSGELSIVLLVNRVRGQDAAKSFGNGVPVHAFEAKSSQAREIPRQSGRLEVDIPAEKNSVRKEIARDLASPG